MSITPSPFLPTQIGGCTLWLDAADSSTVVLSGSNVIQWNDKSGNTRNMTSAGTIAYNSAQRRMELPGNSTSFFTGSITSTPIENPSYFIVSRQTTDPGPLFTLQNSSFGYFPRYGPAGLFLQDKSTGFANIVPSPVVNGVDYIHSIVYDTATVNSWLTGTNIVSAGRTAFNTSALDIGARVPNTERMTGFIYEFIVFNRTVTVAERNRMELYLALKWNLTANFTGLVPLTVPLTTTPYSARFNPTSIPNCTLWFDGADTSPTSMILSGSTVTQWNDKSGNGFNASPTGTITYANNGLIFSGTQYLSVPFSANQNVQTVFGILSVGGTSKMTWLGANQMNVSGYQFIIHNNTQNIHIWGGNPIIIGASINQNTRFMYGSTVSNGSIILYANGSQSGSGGLSTVSNSANYVIGSFVTSGTQGEPFTGTINEIIVFTRLLSASERQTTESYLANKWSLESQLETTHTHFSNPAGRTREITRIFRGLVGTRPPPIIINNALLGTDYTITTSGAKLFYNFLATGKTMTVVTTISRFIDYFAIGGGGGGGAYYAAGGGGAGGLQLGQITLLPGAYTITIGTGGAGGPGSGGGSGTTGFGAQGVNTTFGSITAFGGGGGGYHNGRLNGANGGCGGGGAPFTGIGGIGSQGGNGGGPVQSPPAAGGGGGISGNGIPGGNGGNGVLYLGVAYGGGGGAGSDGTRGLGVFGGGNGAGANGGSGSNATANTGGGGGGAGGLDASNGASGGAGGSGIFILSLSN